jgi:hypothetical protein
VKRLEWFDIRHGRCPAYAYPPAAGGNGVWTVIPSYHPLFDAAKRDYEETASLIVYEPKPKPRKPKPKKRK